MGIYLISRELFNKSKYFVFARIEHIELILNIYIEPLIEFKFTDEIYNFVYLGHNNNTRLQLIIDNNINLYMALAK